MLPWKLQDTKNTITLLDRVAFQLQNTIFPQSIPLISNAFLPVVYKSQYALFIKLSGNKTE